VLEYLCDGVKVTLNYLFWEQTVQPLFTPTHINMSSSLTHAERWSLLLVAGASLAVIANTFQGDGAPLVASVAFSTLAFSMTYAFVRWSGPSFVKAGLKGKDMSKLTPKEIPEAMGTVAAAVYILALMAFIPFAFYKDIVAATSGGGNRDVVLTVVEVETGRFLHRFPHSKLSSYQSALNTLQATTILGMADDILDLRWRHKFFIPAIASLPLLIVYYVDFGVTSVVVPNFLVSYMPHQARLIDLSFLYYLYMSALSIFAPNSINILAGINGIEVGQALVIGGLLIVNSSLYLVPFPGNPVLNNGYATHPHPATDSHLLTLYVLFPFLAVSAALYAHNRYPARVFVGDTYCYVAGMTFAVVAITAHFSKTLLLLLVPQIVNFVYSIPQLFKLVPCPRHRLPKFNARTGLLEPSVTPWPAERPPTKLQTTAFFALEKMHLLQVTLDPKTNRISSTSNLTIINLWLVWRGPIREDQLTRELLIMQTLCGLCGLFVRHTMALFIFSVDNRGQHAAQQPV